ncbi:MAG: hypothetical protein E6Q97_21075 [Desulfurellales bacterium]|nr:MAG: hypothetical protein E6Q97_21075 [Desulfurellales bacterium]
MSQTRARFHARKSRLIAGDGVKGPTDQDLARGRRFPRARLGDFQLPAGMLLAAMMGRLGLPTR